MTIYFGKGSLPKFTIIKRIRANKLTFILSEIIRMLFPLKLEAKFDRNPFNEYCFIIC